MSSCFSFFNSNWLYGNIDFSTSKPLLSPTHCLMQYYESLIIHDFGPLNRRGCNLMKLIPQHFKGVLQLKPAEDILSEPFRITLYLRSDGVTLIALN